MDFEQVLEKLFLHYQVFTIVELADKMGLTPAYISNLKKRGSVNPLRKKCMELNIYDEIFGNSIMQIGGDISKNSSDVIQNINNSQVKTRRDIKDILSSAEIFILDKFREAQSRGEEDQFMMHILNYKKGNAK